MTDDDKALLERLRDFVGRYDCPDGVVDDAADRICELITDIEAQAAEIERLERSRSAWEAVRLYYKTPVDEDEGINWIGIRAIELFEEGFGRD